MKTPEILAALEILAADLSSPKNRLRVQLELQALINGVRAADTAMRERRAAAGRKGMASRWNTVVSPFSGM
jgi:hypothetical protein